MTYLIHFYEECPATGATDEQIKRAYNRNRKSRPSGGNRFYIAAGIVSYLTLNKLI